MSKTDTSDAPDGYVARKVKESFEDPCQECAFMEQDGICPRKNGLLHCMGHSREDLQSVYFIKKEGENE